MNKRLVRKIEKELWKSKFKPVPKKQREPKLWSTAEVERLVRDAIILALENKKQKYVDHAFCSRHG